MSRRVSKYTLDMAEQTVNATLSEINAKSRIQVGKDITGYKVYRTVDSQCIRLLKSGLTAFDLCLYLDGQINGLYTARAAMENC